MLFNNYKIIFCVIMYEPPSKTQRRNQKINYFNA